MTKYVRNPDEVDAIKFTGGANGAIEVQRWIQARGGDIRWDIALGIESLAVLREGYDTVFVVDGDYICIAENNHLYTMLPAYFERMYSEKKPGCHNPECPYCETGAVALPSPVSAMDVVERDVK